MNDLYLIYINKIGTDYKGNYLYDFIFSDKKTGIDGQDWDLAPSSGRAEPPNEIYIKKVGRLETELNFDVVQDSTTFAVWDAVDGIVALAYENIDEYESYPEKRLFFHFGETYEVVTNKLYEQDLILKDYIEKNERKKQN